MSESPTYQLKIEKLIEAQTSSNPEQYSSEWKHKDVYAIMRDLTYMSHKLLEHQVMFLRNPFDPRRSEFTFRFPTGQKSNLLRINELQHDLFYFLHRNYPKATITFDPSLEKSYQGMDAAEVVYNGYSILFYGL